MRLPRPIEVLQPLRNIEGELKAYMEKKGFHAPEALSPDGKIHRFSTNGSSDDDAGWYVFYGDDNAVAVFGDWRSDERHVWSAGGPHVSEERVRRVVEQRDKERKDEQKAAAEKARRLYSKGKDIPCDHPYLLRKKITPQGFAVLGDNNTIMLPMFDSSMEIQSLQFISDDGKKRFLKGGKVSGCFLLIGETPNTGDTIMLCEGYATGVSVHDATGNPTFVAFSAGNLKPVADMLGVVFPDTPTVVIADNDTSGTGLAEASKTGCKVCLIPEPGMDANDYVNAGNDLAAFIERSCPKRWLVRADEFLASPAPLAWLIKGWVQKEALVMVHGPSGSGKTFIVLDWLLHISTGQSAWFGNKVSKGDVIYLCGEGHHGLHARIAAWVQEHQSEGTGNLLVSKSATDLDQAAGIALVKNQIQSCAVKPDLICIDTLNRFLLGDENSAQDTKVFLDACSDLMRTYRCTVLIIHHTGVSESAQGRGRGSSAWRGALDAEVSITKEDSRIEVSQKKMKDTEMRGPMYLTLKQVPVAGWKDEDGEQVTSTVIRKYETGGPVDGTPYNRTDIDALRRAYNVAGVAVFGKPMILISKWREYLKSEGMDSLAIKNFFRLSGDKRRLVRRLVDGGVIALKDDCYEVLKKEVLDGFLL